MIIASKMPRKGFVCLDRTNVMDITDQTYHVVCYPRRIIELNLLDLPQTDGDISHNQLTNIHLLDFFK